MILATISQSMNSGQLAKSNPDIIALFYYTESDRNILFTPLIISDSKLTLSQRGWPMILGVLFGILLLFALLLAALWKRLAREKHTKFLEVHDGDGSLSSFGHLHLKHYIEDSGNDTPSNLSSPLDDIPDHSSIRDSHDGAIYFDSETFADEDSDMLGIFVHNRRIEQSPDRNSDENTNNSDEGTDDDDYLTSKSPKPALFFRIPSESVLSSYQRESTNESFPINAFPNVGERISDDLLICSICYKSTEGMPRKLCACGKNTCHLSAHTLCVLEKYPLPSVAHPGTPPTMLPIVLCRYKPSR